MRVEPVKPIATNGYWDNAKKRESKRRKEIAKTYNEVEIEGKGEHIDCSV